MSEIFGRKKLNGQFHGMNRMSVPENVCFKSHLHCSSHPTIHSLNVAGRRSGGSLVDRLGRPITIPGGRFAHQHSPPTVAKFDASSTHP